MYASDYKAISHFGKSQPFREKTEVVPFGCDKYLQGGVPENAIIAKGTTHATALLMRKIENYEPSILALIARAIAEDSNSSEVAIMRLS
jgi:hypothetical protein